MNVFWYWRTWVVLDEGSLNGLFITAVMNVVIVNNSVRIFSS